MNKEEFIAILEVALLYFDKLPEENIRRLLPEGSAYPDTIVKAGIKLCEYLQSLELNQIMPTKKIK